MSRDLTRLRGFGRSQKPASGFMRSPAGEGSAARFCMTGSRPTVQRLSQCEPIKNNLRSQRLNFKASRRRMTDHRRPAGPLGFPKRSAEK